MLTRPSDMRTASDSAAEQGKTMSSRQQIAYARAWLFCLMAGIISADIAVNAPKKRMRDVAVFMS